MLAMLLSSQLIMCPGDSFYSMKCPSVLSGGNATISAAPQPTCEKGWTLVTFPGTAIAMCAHDLRQPEKK